MHTSRMTLRHCHLSQMPSLMYWLNSSLVGGMAAPRSNGKRGWFPSNYVEVLKPQELYEANEQEPDENELWELQQQWKYRHQHQPQRPTQQHRQRLLDQEMQQQLRLSLHATDMLIPSNNTPQQQQQQDDASGWIVQTTEDGSEQYYYNTRTQEMRYSIPPEIYMDEKVKQALASSNGHLDTSSPNTSMNDVHDQFERPPVRPVRAANRVMTEDSRYNNTTRTAIPPSALKDEFELEFEDDERLPPNWVRKVTPKGRFYYCNIKTEETTWALENIDPDTGILMSSVPDSAFPTTQPSKEENYHQPAAASPQHERASRPSSAESDSSEIKFQGPMTWQNLSSIIAHAIHKLKDSVRQGYTKYFCQDSTQIVHGIRMLLYVSQCLDKETSVHLKQHKHLRSLHRSLLAALAKLVLSTKVASSAWPTPESLAKLESDSDDVLIAVRNFMTCAQDMQIQLKDAKPVLTDGPWRTNPLTSMMGKSDMVTATLVLADNVRGAMTSFSESVGETFQQQDLKMTLETLKANAPLLVAQFRNLSNTTSHFLNTVEEMSQTTPELIKCKQPIYAAMGSLFVVSQSITSSELNEEQVQAARQRLEECLRAIESGIKDVVDMAKHQPGQHQPQLAQPLQPPHMAEERDTPTPTQRHYMNASQLSPTTTATTHALSLESRDDEEDQSAEELANNIRRLDIGLNTLMSNPIEVADDVLSDSSSYHSDMTANQAVRQHKDMKITKFFGEDTIAAARRRDTILTSPTMTNASLSPTTNPLLQTGTSTASAIGTAAATETPWFLQSDVDTTEMIFNMEGNVKGGSLHCLVQRLTQHDQLDSKFNTTFLLTYRSFCTTQELFNELFNRYQLPAPEELTPEELELWKEKKLKLVRLRVFNVIKSWLETYFNEEEDRPILPEISHFTEHVIVESMKFGAEQLAKLIKKRMLAEDSSQIRKMKLNVRTADMPVPILPKNMKRIKLLELDPHELARQMTIMDFKLYNKIKPVECLDKNWGKPDSDQNHIAANVKASIEHSNQVTAWVTDSILSKEEVKKRAAVLKHWIFVAERCRLLNNYNTCMAILSAFDNGSIGRLKRTWELISARTIQILQNIRRLMGANKNFSEYRDIIHKINPPCIPFLGIYLQDLTFIEDGNANFLKKSNNLINFAKRMKTAEVIRDLQQYQSTHYMLTAVPDIQEFIKTHLHSSREEEELYNLSLRLEPRERGEDTIARRLKESGL
ncbi:cell division control protein Cdc25 [Mucor ambiguus]|uniref:Cell division control protein Cdc25 n=1 Tax=Mucor ambiguus TaxID=91626 RepID=A0A0C9MIT2_9FUNG|nr:cell division control protein Cdc25 [Mucor ambiguus]